MKPKFFFHFLTDAVTQLLETRNPRTNFGLEADLVARREPKLTTERRAKQPVFSVCCLDYIWVFLIRTVSSSEFLILLLNQSYERISFDINCGANFVSNRGRLLEPWLALTIR